VGTAHPTISRERHRESTVWQRRFWEHQIRDEYVKLGIYYAEWGIGEIDFPEDIGSE